MSDRIFCFSGPLDSISLSFFFQLSADSKFRSVSSNKCGDTISSVKYIFDEFD